MNKVFLTGVEFDGGNRGCRALATSLVSLIMSNKKDAAITYAAHRCDTVASGDSNIWEIGKTRPVAYVKTGTRSKLSLLNCLMGIVCRALLYRTIPLRALRSKITRSSDYIKAIIEADFVGDIRVGDSFSDIYGLKRLITGSLPVLFAIILGKKPILLPQTYGPYKSRIARYLAAFIMRRSRIICARDSLSLEIARSQIGKASHVELLFCPDVAFVLKPEPPESPNISPPLEINSAKVVVGLNISSLLYSGNYGKNITFGIKLDFAKWIGKLVDQLMLVDGLHILLIPHVYGSGVDDDVSVCKIVWESLSSQYGERIHLVAADYSETRVKGIIGFCDFFIGARMHACIAALSQGIPAVAMAYSDKFVGVFQCLGLQDSVIDARQTSTDEALQKCLDIFHRRSAIQINLEKLVQSIREDIVDNFNRHILSCECDR
jgi:polysaccharide pyruvyl transferase WcaK-like protein